MQASRKLKRVLQLGLGLSVALTVWIVGFQSSPEAAPVVPDTETQFSLDPDVIATADHAIIYAVEQRARPYYRIFSFNPRTGDVETIFTVPEDAIIYGISLNPAGDALAVAYAPSFELGGSGLWTFDLAGGDLTEVVPVTSDVYFTDPVWSPDGEYILATQVDRSATDEQLSIVRVSAESGLTLVLVDDAINPVQVADSVYYLTVDENQARRSIGVVDEVGETSVIEIGDSGSDLDHLLAGQDALSLRVAVLETEGGGLTIGAPAEAHGNHNVSSSWWTVSVDNANPYTLAGLEPIVVYDASATSDTIIYATGEGLAIGTTERVDLIKSRAIRFVAS